MQLSSSLHGYNDGIWTELARFRTNKMQSNIVTSILSQFNIMLRQFHIITSLLKLFKYHFISKILFNIIFFSLIYNYYIYNRLRIIIICFEKITVRLILNLPQLMGSLNNALILMFLLLRDYYHTIHKRHN